jgi:hypothetical protein
MKSSDLSLRIANTIGLLRATQSPVGGADWVRRRICRLHAMGVLARRLGCYIETGGRPVTTERRETRTVASVLRVTARAARCYIA